MEQTADEIRRTLAASANRRYFPDPQQRRIGTFISPHGRVSDDALGVAKNQSTKKFMQASPGFGTNWVENLLNKEHISQFDDHFVLKHLKPFEEVRTSLLC